MVLDPPTRVSHAPQPALALAPEVHRRLGGALNGGEAPESPDLLAERDEHLELLHRGSFGRSSRATPRGPWPSCRSAGAHSATSAPAHGQTGPPGTRIRQPGKECRGELRSVGRSVGRCNSWAIGFTLSPLPWSPHPLGGDLCREPTRSSVKLWPRVADVNAYLVGRATGCPAAKRRRCGSVSCGTRGGVLRGV